MADPKIRIRRSATPNKVPETSQLQLGELAINTFDGKLYLEQDQTSASGIATVIAVNPWGVGIGSTAYNTYFTSGDVGIGTTNPTAKLDVVGDVNISGVITASSFVKSGGTSSQFLKADGSVDSSTYLTSYTETQTLDDVLTLGNVSGIGMSVGVVTATAFIGDGSGLQNVPASIGINTNILNQSQLLTYSVSYGSTTGLGATDGLVFNPSNIRLGIGSATPAYSLDVAGDINSSTDVKINGTGVLDTALALAIALG